MAFLDFLPGLLTGAAAIFGPDQAGPEYTKIDPAGPNIPGGETIEAIGQRRSAARS